MGMTYYDNQHANHYGRLFLTVALPIAVLLLLVSCSTTKNITEDDPLYTGLKEIKYTGTEGTIFEEHLTNTQIEIEAALASPPNGALFGSSYYRSPFPFGLWIWNSCNESSGKFKKWLNNTFGSTPILISNVNPALHALVAKSVLRNNGYIHGDVSYEIVPHKNPKKAKIAYTVRPDTLFTIDTMAYVGFPKEMKALIDSTMWESRLRKDAPFTVSSLDAERTRLTTLFRNNGYYLYNTSYASYLADTLDTPNRAQLRLQLADSLPSEVLRKWYIGQMRVNMRRTLNDQPTDSLVRRYLKVYYSGKRSPIRPGVILRDIKIRPRQLYSYDDYLESAQNINSVGLYSSTDFNFTPRPGTDTLDVTLTCTFDKPYDFYIEGNLKNRTIGHMGPELKIGVTRRNAFRGGEKIDLNLHGSYEWQTNGDESMNSYSYGADLSVEFPRILAPFVSSRGVKRTKDGKIKLRKRPFATPSTVAKVSTDIIMRPDYYKMHIVSGEWSYKWRPSEKIQHEFSPLLVKYQFKNRFTDKFKEILLTNPYLQVSMDDYFIPQMQYTFTYMSEKGAACPYRWETTFEESGNVSSLYFLAKGKGWTERNKELFKTPYSQFLKVETEYTKSWPMGDNSNLVAHANAGIIWCYGNSWSYPFSEGFYVGGANSIRAFSARSIGPGNFSGSGVKQVDYMLRHGSIKMVFNLEYRQQLFGNLYGAIFLDAGNVWSQRGHALEEKEYDDQPEMQDFVTQWNAQFDGSKLRMKNFLGQLATGTGLGLRYDLDFLVVRVDWGFGLHVPYETSKSGYFNIERFKDMHSLHLAIGYPF